MFSGLTSLIFGNKKENNSENSSPTISNNCNPNLSFKTKEDDGWVVISEKKKRRRESNEPHDFTDVALEDVPPSLNLDISCDFEMDCSMSPSPTVASPAPSTPSSLTHLEPDGSWYLTPPPCFTTATDGCTGSVLSPMENLLIEHPSMSVYQSPTASKVEVKEAIKPRPKRGELCYSSMLSPARDLTKSLQDRESLIQLLRRQALHCKPSPLLGEPEPVKQQPKVQPKLQAVVAEVRDPKAELRELLTKERHQRMAVAASMKSDKGKVKNLCPNQMDRNNKIREIASAGRRKQSRKDRIRSPSGANNNRKC